MPHIHTEAGQHDMTVSAYIVRKSDNGEWLCLVHMHRKIGRLMQAGGHIELSDTPWASVAHELKEEIGYTFSELQVAQPFDEMPIIQTAIIHPLPIVMNTHSVMDGHYHSDHCYVFVANDEPVGSPAAGESKDLRWLTLNELEKLVADGKAMKDTGVLYRYFIDVLPKCTLYPAQNFSVEEPVDNGRAQMARFYFTRHGESEANVNKVFAGWTDSPLTKKGRDDARVEAERLRSEGYVFDLILSSPLVRAYDTAKVIAETLGYPVNKIVKLEELKERNAGAYEGNPSGSLDGIKGDDPIGEKGGESRPQFEARVIDAFGRIRNVSIGHKKVLIVAHAGWYKMALALIEHKDTAEFFELPTPANNEIIDFPL